VFLSESRLLHLFKEQIGLPIRNYILWIRLKKVVELIANGESLTYAAHEAGFSDSAHLSKIFLKSIGINPSFLIKNSKFIQVFVPDLV
jgi:AraC-like DNA-binding protein